RNGDLARRPETLGPAEEPTAEVLAERTDRVPRRPSRDGHIVRRDPDAPARTSRRERAARDELPSPAPGQAPDAHEDVAGDTVLDRAGLDQAVVDGEAQSRDRHVAHGVGKRLAEERAMA